MLFFISDQNSTAVAHNFTCSLTEAPNSEKNQDFPLILDFTFLFKPEISENQNLYSTPGESGLTQK